MTEQRTLDEDDAIVGPAPWAAPAEEAPRSHEPRKHAAPQRSPETAGRRSLSSRLLVLLIVLLIGLGAGLFGGPRLAPMLPAPVATLLAPAQQGVDPAMLDTVRAMLTERIAALETALDETQRTARSAVEAAQQAQTQAAQASGAGGVADDLSARLDTLEAEIDSLAETVSAAASGNGAVPSAALRGLQSRVDALAAAVENTGAGTDGTDVTALRERVSDMESRLERDIAARDRALDAAGDAQRAVTVTTALAEIDRAMTLGQPFGPALENLAEAAGVTPSEELMRAAEEGVATREALLNGFNPAAYDAVSEGLAAKETEGVGGVLARVQARFTGIPTEPEAGASAPAILSRARHALLEGDIEAALAEIADLPEPAQAAMAEWIERARLRHAADTALQDLRVELGESF